MADTATLSARNAKRPRVGRFAFLMVTSGWEPTRVRRIRLERIRTAAGWPRSAQREGV